MIIEKIIVIGREDWWSNVVLPELCSAICCIIQSLKSMLIVQEQLPIIYRASTTKYN